MRYVVIGLLPVFVAGCGADDEDGSVEPMFDVARLQER